MNTRKGLLMRVGIDQTYGEYNSPINPATNAYIYMPIPQENPDFLAGLETTYESLAPHFKSWCFKNKAKLEFPQNLNHKSCHLDPDFDFSTYGDQATGRGLRVGDLNNGDFIVFFASFKPISECGHKLVYAIYGKMVVDKVLRVADIPKDEFHKNAHTRIKNTNENHLVVFANPSLSGRFSRAIPIGEYRDGSYRLTKEIIDVWGGIGVKNGFIQRSICPPWFTEPEKFLQWLDLQQVKLINSNWK